MSTETMFKMEYRCRLGTPGGEVIEGVYVAEARLGSP